MASRIQPALLVSAGAAATFTTTSPAAAGFTPIKKTSRPNLPGKQKKTYKKRVNIVPVKKPQPGERKAFRKRIQLSNNSALPVEGLEKLDAENLVRDESAGKVFALPDDVVDQLRALEAFKTTQSWNLFRQPHVLVRRETVDLMRRLEASTRTQGEEVAGRKEAVKCVIAGSKLSGKSMLALQAMAYGLLNKWVVINIPEGIYL